MAEELKHTCPEGRKYSFPPQGTLVWVDTYGKRLAHALTLAPARTRGELAEHLEITDQAIGAVIRSPTSQLKALNSARAAQYLRVDHHWLATGEGDARPRPALSPLGVDLATAFDGAPLQVRDRLYAALMQTIDLASEPRPPTGQPVIPSSAPRRADT